MILPKSKKMGHHSKSEVSPTASQPVFGQADFCWKISILILLALINSKVLAHWCEYPVVQ